MVEFAIVLPLLLMLVFGIVDFARAFALLNNLTSAVREGARYGATRYDLKSGPATAVTAIQNKTKGYVSNFGGGSASYTVTVECTNSTGTKSACTAVSGNPQSVIVTIPSYPFTALTPLVRFAGTTIAMPAVSAVFRWEQSGS